MYTQQISGYTLLVGLFSLVLHPEDNYKTFFFFEQLFFVPFFFFFFFPLYTIHIHTHKFILMSLLLTKTCEYAILVTIQQGNTRINYNTITENIHT